MDRKVEVDCSEGSVLCAESNSCLQCEGAYRCYLEESRAAICLPYTGPNTRTAEGKSSPQTRKKRQRSFPQFLQTYLWMVQSMSPKFEDRASRVAKRFPMDLYKDIHRRTLYCAKSAVVTCTGA